MKNLRLIYVNAALNAIIMVIGTGIDITEVKRIKNAVEKWGQGFLSRVFTDVELVNARKRQSFYQHLAGRFAAKEAVFKALGESNLKWKDVEVLNDGSGRPYCAILSAKDNRVKMHISISHVKNYAVACAVAARKDEDASCREAIKTKT